MKGGCLSGDPCRPSQLGTLEGGVEQSPGLSWPSAPRRPLGSLCCSSAIVVGDVQRSSAGVPEEGWDYRQNKSVRQRSWVCSPGCLHDLG